MTPGRNRQTRFEFRLDPRSGVPVYRQLIDQVSGAIACGALVSGDQLPTVRQVAVDLSINPNTVVRAYRELEIRGIIETQQGTGTFVGDRKIERDEIERRRELSRIAGDFIARAGAAGFTLSELLEELHDRQNDAGKRNR